MAPCMCTPTNVQRNSHCYSSLIENPVREFSLSYCFMNTIYEVTADCTALLVVSTSCAIVKVMTGSK